MALGLPAYERFYFRTSHLWYFKPAPLQALCKASGFSQFQLSFRHSYPMQNALLWLRDARPPRSQALPFLGAGADPAWKALLESQGLSNFLWIELRKEG
jgi:hypothetical protein